MGAEVEEADLAKVIELWTGIPASRIQENELKKLSDLESVLNAKIIGQEEAVSAISAAIRRSRVQISPGAGRLRLSLSGRQAWERPSW